ncbi:hypothetical protein D9611_002740 [Ephemerocybe angulata]|uniref:Uncharacterized protein n=1 Tax=Ephemerocybe angulata TaxID=980116 RepID=A0A8H5C2T4_9AGAR|nr:hypothetical protein D9611_002740 [Tulosesus angulatus]
MSSEPYTHIEQDQDAPPGDDELPTYDDLAAQNGPNSRFGRWRGWIEKRAAERYVDITPQERQRRKERGWELRDGSQPSDQAAQPPPILYTSAPPIPGPAESLHIQTNNLSLNDRPSHSPRTSVSDVQLPFISQPIPPSHLKINHFGSRFLPHATSQIRCILPLLSDRLILIGHDEGLSVLDMFPQEWTENGEIAVKPPNEAQAHFVWRGETVYQMTILEKEETGDGIPQGVVLMLVGPDVDSPSSREPDFRILRMYNLSSLTSLARWAVSQKGARPLDLRQSPNSQAQQSPSRRHKPQGSIARSIKSFINDGAPALQPEQPTPYHSLLTPTGPGPSFAGGAPGSGRMSPIRHDSNESAWDVVEELPLRWATDFVPLASPGSRLSSTSVTFYTTWSDRTHRSNAAQLLAIATKNSILLYESPKGERAYRFVKDFYTPLQPRSMTFFHQHVTQETSRPSSESSRHRRGESSSSRHGSEQPRGDGSPNAVSYGVHLCIFVVFDKKAGWIRLADSAVGEFELRDDGGLSHPSMSARDSLSPGGSLSGRNARARLSFEIRESAARWILPAQCEVPVTDPHTNSIVQRPILFLTRGRRTHLVHSPLSTKLAAVPPLHVIHWRNTPKQVSARVCHPSRGSLASARYPLNQAPFLQVVSFGESGLEIYETSLSALWDGSGSGKGKRKVVNYDSARAEEDLGGDVGFLQTGGNWDQADELYSKGLERMDSVSGASFSTVETGDLFTLLKQEAGMYGWCQKGLEDYRIFWVGGTYDVASQDGGDAGSFYS